MSQQYAVIFLHRAGSVEPFLRHFSASAKKFQELENRRKTTDLNSYMADQVRFICVEQIPMVAFIDLN